jgi:formate hydrogenlyase transcriptional activator
MAATAAFKALELYQAAGDDVSAKSTRHLTMRALSRGQTFGPSVEATDIREEPVFREIVGTSLPLLDVLRQVRQIAARAPTTLILGESGVGKGLVARAAHACSPRANGPLVVVNCGTLPKNLMETELFGAVRGALAGTVGPSRGLFEKAAGGTLVLDEIGELPLDLQAKVLYTIQTRGFRQVGGTRNIPFDALVVACTSRNVYDDVENHRLREDLFFTLNLFPIHVPPLRQRRSDIEALAAHFAGRYAAEWGKRIVGFGPSSFAMMREYSWPGNVRQLENLVQQALVLADGPVLEIDASLLSGIADSNPEADNRIGDWLNDRERQLIMQALKDTQRLGDAARSLGVDAQTLRTQMKKLGIHASLESQSES